MPLEVHILTNAFPTLLTHVGLIARLSPWPHEKESTLAESSWLLLPGRKLPPGVEDPVLDEVVTLAEAFPTLTTLI